jgi:hypothetical protein
VRERPILFSGPMVRELLAGRKTQTRRPVKPQPPPYLHGREMRETSPPGLWGAFAVVGDVAVCREEDTLRCPYGTKGDGLWVRETWQQVPPTPQALRGWPGIGDRPRGPSRWNPAAVIIWRADGEMPAKDRWRPGIHMPRWASRLLLEVTAVRIERLDAITEDDARAEGMEGVREPEDEDASARDVFLRRWDLMYGGTEFSTHFRTWVWVVSFRRVEAARSAA